MALSIRSGVVELDPSQVPLWLSSVAISQHFQAAVVTALAYYTATTLDKEVKHFWGAGLNQVSVIYFTNRYTGLLGAISLIVWDIFGTSLPLCKRQNVKSAHELIPIPQVNFLNGLVIFQNRNLDWFTIISIDYILMIRVLALFSHSRRLGRVLKTLLGFQAIIKLVMMLYVTVTEDIVIVVPGQELPTTCGVEDGAQSTTLGITGWAIAMVYGVILMVLALYKAAEYWRLSGGFKGIELLKVLMIDQAIYFVLTILCCVLNLMDYKLVTSNTFLSGLLASLGSPSFLCIMGSNMLFNLKEAAERGVNQGTSYSSTRTSVSAMEFS